MRQWDVSKVKIVFLVHYLSSSASILLDFRLSSFHVVCRVLPARNSGTANQSADGVSL